MTTSNETATPTPSFACPAVQELFPGAKHSLYRDQDHLGEDYWTTECSHCGEIPLCSGSNHSFDFATNEINGVTEFVIECQDCGFKYITTEQEYRVAMAHKDTAVAMSKAAPEPRVAVADLSDLGERPFKLYKILITEVPAVCDDLRWEWDEDVQALVRTRGWKPAGWVEYVRERILDGAKWSEDQHFFWPSEDKTYRSRSTAAGKVAIVERWGGKAIILEADVSAFVPAVQAKAKRSYERKMAQVHRVEAKAAALLNEARILKMKSAMVTEVAF